MFFVGDTSAAAAFYWDEVRRKNPRVRDAPPEELSLKELKRLMVLAKMAYDRAIDDGASGDALAPLLDPYRDLFLTLCELDEGFLAWVTGRGLEFHPWELVSLVYSED